MKVTLRWAAAVSTWAPLLFFAQGISANAGTCSPPAPPVRQVYFSRFGVGAAYGPHYPCYQATGAIAQCFTNTGAATPGAKQDWKNFEPQASVPLDLQQVASAGFKSIRAYGEPSKTWIAMINAINDKSPGLNLVYEVSLCKSDVKTGQCIDRPGVNFNQILEFSQKQLNQVIEQTTPQAFQKAVRLIIVGNEDLVSSPTDKNAFNTSDLKRAITRTKATLQARGVKVNTAPKGEPNGIDVSSAVFIGQMTTTQGKDLATAFTPMAPVIENMYPAQFSHIANATQAITFLKQEIDRLQSAYPNNSAMLGETGWWTAGQDANYQAKDRIGNLNDAKAYFALLYPYLQDCKVPAIIFEAYDQPIKNLAGDKPNPPGALQAEQNYGVMTGFNVAKDRTLLPKPSPSYRDHPETRNAAPFTFVQVTNVSSASPMTFGITNPGEKQEKVTARPFNMVTISGFTPVWPTFNLTKGAQVSLFRRAVDPKPLCSNTVDLIYSQSVKDRPPYAGGEWRYKNYSASGCNQPPNNVNWESGPNVFLPANFSPNFTSAPFVR